MPDTLKTLFKRIQEGMEGLAGAVIGDRAERLLDEEIRAVDDALHEITHVLQQFLAVLAFRIVERHGQRAPDQSAAKDEKVCLLHMWRVTQRPP